MLLDRLSYRSVQRLLPVVIALHNAEEALTAPAYLPRVDDYVARVPLLRDAGLPPSLTQLYIALVVVTIVPALMIGWATSGRESAAKRGLVAVVAAALLWNVLLPHVSAMIAFRGYAPGGLTALVVNLPFCVYFFRRSSRDGILTRGEMTWAIIFGLFLLALVPLLLLF
ncbi:MAG TPA: HXXEE domain-containing protein [Hyphomicrobiaceae bacterium]|nr:HXXEE domain-containing protein [Hyphomicrobiaceae bacterium]